MIYCVGWGMLCILKNVINRRPVRAFSAGYSHPLWTQHKPERPFAQFNGSRFIGFTLTLLTLTTTPTNGHAPYFLQPPSEHALFTRSLLSYWPQLRTHSAVIGWVLPPAGACCEVCFSFFFPPPYVLHTQLRGKEASQRKKRPQPNPSTANCTGNRRLFVLYWLWQQKSDI